MFTKSGIDLSKPCLHLLVTSEDIEDRKLFCQVVEQWKTKKTKPINQIQDTMQRPSFMGFFYGVRNPISK